jgi:hypothetical protein
MALLVWTEPMAMGVIRIEVKAGKIVSDAAEKAPRRIKLPYTEAELL